MKQAFIGEPGENDRLILISVSYTHLDVYKRQVYYEFGARGRFPVVGAWLQGHVDG